MKCLNQNCTEQVSVGNYCPAHAISAGKVYRNVDEKMGHDDSPTQGTPPAVGERDGRDPGREPGEGGRGGGESW
jgi:hypothetical protein